MKKIVFVFLIFAVYAPVNAAPNYSYTSIENYQVDNKNNYAYNLPPSEYSNTSGEPIYSVKSSGYEENNALLVSHNIPVKSNNIIVEQNGSTVYVNTGQKYNTRAFAGDVFRGLACALDPYAILYNNETYVFIKDNGDGIWNMNDIFGIKDSKRNIFRALKKLNKDHDKTKISSAELKAGGIRLVKLGKNDVLELNNPELDLNSDAIDYIDMNTLRKIDNEQKYGIFGSFYVYVNTDYGPDITFGTVSFLSKKDLNQLIGK